MHEDIHSTVFHCDLEAASRSHRNLRQTLPSSSFEKVSAHDPELCLRHSGQPYVARSLPQQRSMKRPIYLLLPAGIEKVCNTQVNCRTVVGTAELAQSDWDQ
jgi:hypothetical protein